jgi:integrase
MWQGPPDPETGKRPCRYGATKKEAREKGRTFLAQPATKWRRATSETSLEEATQSFIEAAEDRLRPATLGQYRTLLATHVLPRRGQLPVARMKRDHVESLYRELRDSGASLRTIQATHTALRQVIKHALDQGWIDEERDPMTKVRRPGGSKQARVKNIAVPHWTAEELSRILHTARETLDRTHKLLVETLAGTGCRIGEALGLRFRDHTHRANTLKIERSWTKAREVAPGVWQGVVNYGRRITPDLLVGLYTRTNFDQPISFLGGQTTDDPLWLVLNTIASQ